MVKDTFNMMSVDGDTSTNDMVTLMANGAAGGVLLTEKNEEYAVLVAALRQVCTDLCRKLAADGEGATKLLECRVTGAGTEQDARTAAKARDQFRPVQIRHVRRGMPTGAGCCARWAIPEHRWMSPVYR